MAAKSAKAETEDRDRTGACITDEELDLAAKAYLVDRLGWMTIYRTIGNHGAATWLAARKTKRWEEACEPYRVRLNELGMKALNALEHRVDAGDMNAIKEALDRCEGAVEQKLDVNVHGDSPCETLRSRIAGLAARVGAAGAPGEPE